MALSAHPSHGAPRCRLVVEDYYHSEDEPTQTSSAAVSVASASAAASASLQSAPLLLSVTGSELVSEVVRRYRVHTQRRALRDPVVFLAHPPTGHADAAVAAAAASAATTRPASASASASASAAASISVAAAIPAAPSSSCESGLALLQRVRGKRVQLSAREIASCTLSQLGVRDGSVLTVRARPFPLRILVDNSQLKLAGVPTDQLDVHAVVVWAEERSSVLQLREEYVRQVRENPRVLGCDRHRFFVRPARAPLDDDNDGEEEEKEEQKATHAAGASRCSTTAPSDALEITMQDARLLQSLPLRAHSVVWVQKDPSRWLSDAVRAGDETRAQKLIDLGADAHLLDARGYSSFFYAQQLALQRAAKAAELQAAATGSNGSSSVTRGDVEVHNGMQLLLQRNFGPTSMESRALQVLLDSYSGWLASGACVQKHSVQWVREGDVREYDDYAFVHSGVRDPAAMLRPVTSERHKIVGYVNLKRGILGGTAATDAPHGNAVAPFDLQTAAAGDGQGSAAEAGVELAALPSSSSPGGTAATAVPWPSPGGPGPTRGAEGMWGMYNRAPETLLFDLEVTQPDREAPVKVLLRSPQFPAPTASNTHVNSLRHVSPFRSLVTRFDVFKNAYMMNLKLGMLLVSACSALYAFAFSARGGKDSVAGEYGVAGELRAIFALTMAKACAAGMFLLRSALPLRTLRFPTIKSALLRPGGELRAAECWFYFLVMEAMDAAMIVCNVRVLAALMAGTSGGADADGDGRADGAVWLSPSDLSPGAGPLSEAQSMFLSILLSLLSLVALNLADTAVSFLADETPRLSGKVRRYLLLHLPVLVGCFAALRLCFDLREMQLSNASSSFTALAAASSTGFLSYLTPTTLAFLLSYLCGLSLKNLQVLFHPPMNHALADEMLGRAAMDTDSKASVAYVLLACVVYGAANNPASEADREMIARREEGLLFPLALGLYFASAIVLAATALLPFMLRALDGQVQWAPPMLSKAAQQFVQLVRARVASVRGSNAAPSVQNDGDERPLLEAQANGAHPHAA